MMSYVLIVQSSPQRRKYSLSFEGKNLLKLINFGDKNN